MGWWFELIVREFFCMFVISNHELIFNVNQKRERERSMNQGADYFI